MRHGFVSEKRSFDIPPLGGRRKKRKKLKIEANDPQPRTKNL